MTEEQNKLAFDEWCKELASIVGPALLVLDGELRLRRSIDLEAFYKRHYALREPDPVLGECEECGHTIVTPLKRFATREPATEAVLEALKSSPCGRLLQQEVCLQDALVDTNCEPCDCWRAALKGKGASQGDEDAKR